ncbi:pyridoxamine 5'-phosphate oxidase family protein [Eudoraea sp.]|uniref:pyridoxamine 5'-phosphate oxidase family protein n=1 Tax=Eudoraea sp. TaxID=1979955 RepID=UPI003C72EC1C
MNLSTEIKNAVDKSILCWLATASLENEPNVSPKEVFSYYGTNSIIIANIASPQSVQNIKKNPKVCLSFIDILVQKGFQLKGDGIIIELKDPNFKEMHDILSKISGGIFPFSTLTKVNIKKVKPIIAPRYYLFPDTTEQAQIKSAKDAYGL